MLSRKTACVLIVCLAFSVVGCSKDDRDQIVNINIGGPSPLPNPQPGGTATQLTVRHELWLGNGSGQRLGSGPIATVTSTYFPDAANARMPGTQTAGSWYFLQSCVSSSGVPSAQRNGRQYTIWVDWIQDGRGNPTKDGPKPLDGGEVCHRFGTFKPDTSGAVFETTLDDQGGTPAVNRAAVSNVYVDAK